MSVYIFIYYIWVSTLVFSFSGNDYVSCSIELCNQEKSEATLILLQEVRDLYI